MVLRTRGLTKEFGGLTAVDEVDFRLGSDELCSLIGPNGAGKTTFFNLLTGALEPTSGTVEVRTDAALAGRRVGGDGRNDASAADGERENDAADDETESDAADGRTGDGSDDGTGTASDGGPTTVSADAADPDAGGDADGWLDVTDAAPHETAGLGLHRSYQITNVFPESTVFENVRIAAQAVGEDAANFWRNAGSFDAYREEATAILDRVDLLDHAEEPASALSHGAKRQLEVGIALAGDPDVLLLDEPNAGVSSESVDDIIALIEDVATDHAVLLVEHNMDIVMNVSDRVVVLNQGELIADGPPAAVRDDPAVQEAYLGGYERGDAVAGRGDAPNGVDAEDDRTNPNRGGVGDDSGGGAR